MKTWWYSSGAIQDHTVDHWYLDGRRQIVYIIDADGDKRQTRLLPRTMDMHVNNGILVVKMLPGKYAKALSNNRKAAK